jgi:putative tryptophan/tyrosine transport system substrate-binding protein
MDRRRFLITSMAGVAAPCAVARAERAGQIYRVGYLDPAEPLPRRSSALQSALGELGYIHGRDYTLESRFASGELDRLTELAAALVRARVDVIVAVGRAIDAARGATDTIPIVMLFSGIDPVVNKRVSSLAHPGGNVTGIAILGSELTDKRLELLLQLIPGAKRTAYVYSQAGVVAPDSLAVRVGVTLIKSRIASPGEVDGVLGSLARQKVDAVVFGALGRMWPQVVEAASRYRLPACYQTREPVESGGLMSLSPDFVELGRRGASFVDRILKGAKPGDLPIEQPTKFEFVINLKTAKALGLTIPPSLLARADQIIE